MSGERGAARTRALVLGVLGALVIAGVVLLFSTGGEDTYDIDVRLENANGLRDGSPVVVGGVNVGEVTLEATDEDVRATLKIREQYAPVGKDASATIIAQNALGQKQVRLELGDRSDPAPDGYTLDESRVVAATDIDQLLSTFDPDTRTRLAILINETGTAFAGRELSFKTFIRDFAPALSSGGDVLAQLTRDNQALTNLVETSDRYIASLAAERVRLGNALDVLGQTTETVATRRVQLRETLSKAPSALRSTRSFLAELRRTTGPLGSTARLLTEVSPSLREILDRLEPFRAAAVPALDAAILAASSIAALTEDGAGPLKRALPALDQVRKMATKEIPPVGAALEKSIDNLLATVENWSRAIQFSDGLGHIFRGEAAFSPQFYERIVANLTGTPFDARGQGGKDDTREPASGGEAPAEEEPQEPDATEPAPPADEDASPTQHLEDLLEDLTGDLTQPLQPDADGQNEVEDLLDYLLGGPAQ